MGKRGWASSGHGWSALSARRRSPARRLVLELKEHRSRRRLELLPPDLRWATASNRGCCPSKCRGVASLSARKLCSFAPEGRPVTISSHPVSFSCTYVTAVTVACNGYAYGSHAAYMCQGCQAAHLTRIRSIEWRLVHSSAAVFIDLSLRPSTVPTASVASFDYDQWT